MFVHLQIKEYKIKLTKIMKYQIIKMNYLGEQLAKLMLEMHKLQD